MKKLISRYRNETKEFCSYIQGIDLIAQPIGYNPLQATKLISLFSWEGVFHFSPIDTPPPSMLFQ